jgi:XTP/dITP diphosphohydrolase
VPAAASLLLSTRNAHKHREFGRLLAPAGWSVDPLPDDVLLPPEVADTFEGNALPKARAAAQATGRPAIADDSGIEAAALDGAPGVRSARFAGEQATDQENLDLLRARAPVGSALRYVCALVYVDPATSLERTFVGYCTGTLAAEPRGERGFGYDPAFLPDADRSGRTMAELPDVDKDRISHRGAAVRQLLAWLGEAGDEGGSGRGA